MKIRPSIILSHTNNLTYAMDVDDSTSKVFRFEGPAAVFIKALLDKKSEAEILKLTLEKFEECSEEQIEEDYANFLKSIEGFGFLNKK